MKPLEDTIVALQRSTRSVKKVNGTFLRKNGHYRKAKISYRKKNHASLVLACEALVQEGKQSPEIDAVLMEHHKEEGRYAKALHIAKKYAKLEDEGTAVNRKKTEEKIISHKNKIGNKPLTPTYFYEQRIDIQLKKEKKDGRLSLSTLELIEFLSERYKNEEETNYQTKANKLNTIGCFLQIYGKKYKANKKFIEANRIYGDTFCSQHNLFLSEFLLEQKQFKNIHSKQVYESHYKSIEPFEEIDSSKPNPYLRRNSDIEKVCKRALEYIDEMRAGQNKKQISKCPHIEKNISILETYKENMQKHFIDEEKTKTDKAYVLEQAKKVNELVESSRVDTLTILYKGPNIFLR